MAVTARVFRIAQERFGKSPWVMVDARSDQWFGARGYEVVGSRFHAEHLTDDEFAFLRKTLALARPGKGNQWRREMTVAESYKLAGLLQRIPRSSEIGIADVDVREESRDYDFERARATALDYARRIDENSERFGLGRLTWGDTSPKGSKHGNAYAPDNFRSPYLQLGAFELLGELLDYLEIPRGSRLRGVEKEDGPAVFVDDACLLHYPDSAGGLWRPFGASKPDKNYPKRWIPDLARPDDLVLAREHDRTERAPVDRDRLLAAVAKAEASPKPAARRERVLARGDMAFGRAPKDPKKDRLGRITLDVSLGKAAPPTGDHMAFVRADKRLSELWDGRRSPRSQKDATKLDRSKRDFIFAITARKAGVSVETILAALLVMPLGKCAERGEGYARDLMDSVEDHLDIPEPPKPVGEPREWKAGRLVVVKRPRTASHASLADAFHATRALLPPPQEGAYCSKKHRFKRVYAPGWTALSNALHCCRANELHACKKHGSAACRAKVCRYKTTCELCSVQEVEAIAREVLETWPEQLVLWRVPIPHETPPERHALEINALARRMARCVPRGYARRWVKGVDYVVCVLEHGMVERDVTKFMPQLGRVVKLGRETVSDGVLEGIKLLADKRGIPTGGESAFRRVTREAGVREISEALRSPNRELLSMLEAKEFEIASRFAWLRSSGAKKGSDERIVRTGANRAGKGAFPWPSVLANREKARAALLEERHGVPEFECCAVEAVSSTSVTYCRLPYDVQLVDSRTGHELAPPRIGRGFPFHEVATVLEIAALDAQAFAGRNAEL